MDYNIFLDLVKICVPSLLVLVTTYLLISSFLETQLKLKAQELELKRDELSIKQGDQSLPIRYQAYERLILFLERNHPYKLLSTIDSTDLTAPEFQLILIKSIRTEMEHNLTQQLYVSDQAWAVVRSSVEELINEISSLAINLPSNATGKDLGKKILNHFMSKNINIPNDSAVQFLKVEIRTLF